MTKTGKFIFGAIGMSYIFHLLLKFNDVVVPEWFSSYFADLICMPLLLVAALISIRFIKKDRSFILEGKMILFTLVYVLVLFEWILPINSMRYTSDVMDIVMYGLGALLFYCFQKKLLSIKSKAI